MITHNGPIKQLPDSVRAAFVELKIFQHLRIAGITKLVGVSCAQVFTIIFCLIFQNKSWSQTLNSLRAHDIPAKDVVYRFLNKPTYSWRRFLLSLSAHTISKVAPLTSADRPKVLILDDSSFERNRSKKVELLARCFDHASQKMRFYKGFRLLTMGWSGGSTFVPVDFSLLSSAKHKLVEVAAHVDKRSCGYRRRKEALQTAPEQIPPMIERALAAGIDASYVLMDSWFTQPPLLKQIKSQGIDVIGMVKRLTQRYVVRGQKVYLDELYRLATPEPGKGSILRSIQTKQVNGLPVKVIFVRNRNKKSEWLAILSTDLTLTAEEIIKIYGIRWDIEVFFKTTKSLLKLQKEFQGRSYDSMISHTTIVFARYIVLSWQNRCSQDSRTIGGIFYEFCDEIGDLDWAVALQQLMELLQDTLKHSNKKLQAAIQRQLEHWFYGLPQYIRDYLPLLNCET